MLLLYEAIIFGILLGTAQAQNYTDRAQNDVIANLTGATFSPLFNQFAGYLSGNTPDSASSLHYWYMESQNAPSTDPVLVFLNGGPGCSSLVGMLMEMGPFRVNNDAATLYENVFSWNKVASIVAIDAPGVGFSSKPSRSPQTDELVSQSLGSAIIDFYNAFPERLQNPLYVVGEGYGSVFATGATYYVMTKINTAFNLNLKGVIIANGLLSSNEQYNAFIPYAYMHGLAGKEEWDDLRSVCCPNQPTLGCDYKAQNSTCKTKADAAVNNWLTNLNSLNLYEDCYYSKSSLSSMATLVGATNYNSTDGYQGFPCVAESNTEAYLSRADVQRDLHVSGNETITFKSCQNLTYSTLTTDLTVPLSNIINTMYFTTNQMRILFYNGDLDATNTFLSAQNFLQKFVKTTLRDQFNTTTTWKQSYYRGKYQDMDGGLWVNSKNGNISFVTIRGAGHLAPQDRPGPTLQVVRNFIFNYSPNSCLSDVNLAAQPLLPAFAQNHSNAVSRKDADLVTTMLPGLTFQTNFKQYSGYLSGSDSHKFHYWLVESQSDPANDPLLLWLNGGPGSSSLMGLLLENGPFRPNIDGQTLYENPYSWNKFANVLYLESPHNVGFSYSTVDNDTTYNDDQTCRENFNALQDFFNNVFPEYRDHDFYITGESYGGVYIPTLTKYIINEGIMKNTLNIKLKGIAIGNGELTTKHQQNSVIFQQYTYGLIGKTEYDELVSRCCPANVTDPTRCDFYTNYVIFTNLGEYKPLPNADAWCSSKILSYINDNVWNSLNDPYNIYQDCYQVVNGVSVRQSEQALAGFTDNGARTSNLIGSDPFNGFYCWSTDALTSYLGRADVRAVLHIPDFVPAWSSFNQAVNEQYYIRGYFELNQVFQDMMSSYYWKTTGMRTLIYNGDTDMVCNHLGDQWFVEEVAASMSMKTTTERQKWTYVMDDGYKTQTAGWYKIFDNSFTLLTVKGAGHLVPTDRPGPSLQMIYNWVKGNNVSAPYLKGINYSPLFPQYSDLSTCNALPQPSPKPLPTITVPNFNISAVESEVEVEVEQERVKRESVNGATQLTDQAQRDQITSLPGLTFNVTFRQFSGYLHPEAYPLNHLFYWFMESQSGTPANAPVVLWLNGGPGCSSLVGLFTELGPFHNNDDNGQTLYENVWAWNKFANVLYMEAPVGVGFSYRDDWTNYNSSDDNTADTNAAAIKYFFEKVFPEYAKNEFFVTGESYVGVYGPMLTLRLARMIDAGTLNVNLKGMAVGNGILSEYLQDNSMVPLQYGRGFSGYDNWEAVKAACPGNPIYRDYSSDPVNSTCYRTWNKYLDTYYFYEANDHYNVYQDCYTTKKSSSMQQPKRLQSRRRSTRAQAMRNLATISSQSQFVNNNDKSYYGSTDPYFGFPCFNDDNLETYLNRDDVQKAIHVNSSNPRPVVWGECADINYDEQHQYYDMTDVFTQIMNTKAYYNNGMRILLYNGDIDTQCQFLGDTWFIENFVQLQGLQVVKQRDLWMYQPQPSGSTQYNVTLAGYYKQWSKNFTQATVKGAGHMVPMDRPAEMLQLIMNFVKDRSDYNTPITGVSVTPKPLNKDYSPTATPTCSVKDTDNILWLPGLAAAPSFKQYSGYLKSADTHYLHYWLVEAETNAQTAPLILYLDGGPGASGMKALFEQNGPFRLSPNGDSISMNPYSWNKFANLLFLDSPVGVGYSYTTDGKQPVYDDDFTATETLAALTDFFNKYPEYQNRPFYTAGVSYAGVYVPTLAVKLMDAISTKGLKAYYKGLAIGNPVIDKPTDVNTLIHYLYYHGTLSLEQYQNVLNLCCIKNTDELNCQFSAHITSYNNIVYGGDPNDPCYNAMLGIGYQAWAVAYDPENVNQQCYQLLVPGATPVTIGENWSGINYVSSDALDGYPCYMEDALNKFMNRIEVRKAINIPDSLPTYISNSNILYIYDQTTDSDGPVFTQIMNSPIYKNNNFAMAILSGDVDTSCNWLGAEIFTTNYFSNQTMPVTAKRQQWFYQTDKSNPKVVAGYVKRFSMNVDVLTVKGAGHLTALDRAAQTQQLIVNFITRQDYSTPYNGGSLDAITTTAKPTTTTKTTVGSTTPLTVTDAPVVTTADATSTRYPIILMITFIYLRYFM